MLCIHVIIYISIYILFSPYVILGAIYVLCTWYNNYDNNHDINHDLGCKNLFKDSLC